jgi:hypothetical protein
MSVSLRPRRRQPSVSAETESCFPNAACPWCSRREAGGDGLWSGSAAVTAGIYLILGLIVLMPELLKEWTHVGKSEATVLGWTLPVPDSLVHMSLFLDAWTFMYLGARVVGDGEDLDATRSRATATATPSLLLTPPTPVINFTWCLSTRCPRRPPICPASVTARFSL